MDIDWIRLSFAFLIMFHTLARTILHNRASNWEESSKIEDAKSFSDKFRGFGVYTLWFTATCVIWAVFPEWLRWGAIPLPDWFRWAGIATIAMCEAGLVWVGMALGPNFNGSVRLNDDHQLVLRGPYRWVRHPMYSITNVIVVALGVASANWALLLVGLSTYTVVILLRISKEEMMMVERFGSDYILYQARVGALFPRIGWGKHP